MKRKLRITYHRICFISSFKVSSVVYFFLRDYFPTKIINYLIICWKYNLKTSEVKKKPYSFLKCCLSLKGLIIHLIPWFISPRCPAYQSREENRNAPEAAEQRSRTKRFRDLPPWLALLFPIPSHKSHLCVPQPGRGHGRWTIP